MINSMKKFLAICALTAVLIFTGASVWEGSASVSVAGELPDGAYSAATNSYPSNTVVEVTNLENGKTIRVLIAASLDSPGLLAMLSQNAAAAIGIPSQGIGRIRMKESLGPIRTEEPAASRSPNEGDRPGNPAAAAEQETRRTATPEDLAEASPADRFYNTVINQPETYTPDPVDYPADGAVRTEPKPNWGSGQGVAQPSGASPYPASPQDVWVADTAQGLPPYMPDAQAAPDPSLSYYIPDDALSAPALPPYAPTTATTPPAAGIPSAGSSVIILVPAEERPPEGGAPTIPPGTVIGPIPLNQLPWLSSGDVVPEHIIGPIVPNRQSAEVPLQPALPKATVSPAPPPVPNGLSLPQITQLEKGKYYVQIGAFTRTDALETAAARWFSQNFPLAVQSGGSADNSVYRLLVGPLNAGESKAILLQVKSSYPDAFVRNGS
ncbi:hypothetical protein AGMMS49944_03560 [Spirochaetia bacterium]|nr:hypothetical protein AGMMS49944_03560 [Spirochaetia bacterium]